MANLKFLKDADKELKAMLKAAVHFGHNKKKWNPKMKSYIYTSRKNIHIYPRIS